MNLLEDVLYSTLYNLTSKRIIRETQKKYIETDVIRNNMLLAYANEIFILGEFIVKLIIGTFKFFEMALQINYI